MGDQKLEIINTTLSRYVHIIDAVVTRDTKTERQCESLYFLIKNTKSLSKEDVT